MSRTGKTSVSGKTICFVHYLVRAVTSFNFSDWSLGSGGVGGASVVDEAEDCSAVRKVIVTAAAG